MTDGRKIVDASPNRAHALGLALGAQIKAGSGRIRIERAHVQQPFDALAPAHRHDLARALDVGLLEARRAAPWCSTPTRLIGVRAAHKSESSAGSWTFT